MARSRELIINKSIKSSIVEAYKTLRTNIQFSMPDGGPRTIPSPAAVLVKEKYY